MIKALLYDKVMEKGRKLNSKLDGSEKAQKEQEKAMKNMNDVYAAQQKARMAEREITSKP